MENQKVFEQEISAILSTLKCTLQSKNKDYNSSFKKSGLISSLLRMHDKLMRCIHLSQKSAKIAVNDEKLTDTLLDLAGYAVLALMLVENADN